MRHNKGRGLRQLNKWTAGNQELARLKKLQESRMKIVVNIRVQVDGTKRPVCLGCEHSVMSHGERDGKLFCWTCETQNKQCKEGTNGDTGTTGS